MNRRRGQAMRKVLDGAVVTGAVGFIAILALSAAFDHSIIWLHVFQSLMYVAVIGLVLRRNRWGYILGVGIAALWNYINLFVTNFFVSGLHALQSLIATGKLTHPDQLVAVAAVAFHFLMIAACLVRIVQTSRKPGQDLVALAAAACASTAYFWVIVYACQPRYLPLFPRMLHPHGLV